jgi:hypothetical protein
MRESRKSGSVGALGAQAPGATRRLPDTQLWVRRRHFAIARNSLCEVAAAVDLAVAIGALPGAVAGELVARMQRVAALLAGLMR